MFMMSIAGTVDVYYAAFVRADSGAMQVFIAWRLALIALPALGISALEVLTCRDNPWTLANKNWPGSLKSCLCEHLGFFQRTNQHRFGGYVIWHIFWATANDFHIC